MLSKRIVGAAAAATLCTLLTVSTAHAEVAFEGRYNNGVAECRVTKFDYKPISAASYEAATQIENLFDDYQRAYQSYYKAHGTDRLHQDEIILATTPQRFAIAAGKPLTDAFRSMGDQFNSEGPLLQTQLGQWTTVENVFNSFGRVENIAYVQRLINNGAEKFMDELTMEVANGKPNQTVIAMYKSDAATKKHFAALDKAMSLLANDVFNLPQRCAEAAGPAPVAKKENPLFGSLGSS